MVKFYFLLSLKIIYRNFCSSLRKRKRTPTHIQIVMSDFKPKFLKPSESSSFFDRNETSLAETTNFVYNRHISQSIQTQRQRLPIFNNRNHILYLLEKYQTLVLVGETGCGKSTQIPQVRH